MSSVKPNLIPKEAFVERLKELYGEAITQEVIDDISPCLCGNEYCFGWRGDPDLIISNMMKLGEGQSL